MKYSIKVYSPAGLRGAERLDTPIWNKDNNETLFYRLLLDHVEEMLPIVYTPTVGLACQQFSHLYRRPRGLIISYPLRDAIPKILRNRPNRAVDVIVVTDGERILGLGDQGVGGLGIPIGKLSLYTLIGGIHPSRTLQIILDVGTNNQERLNDPEYLGWRHERVMGHEYLDFVDRFVKAVKQELPQTCLQWEDFSTPHARPLLERYQNDLLTFNDDVQGTAAVVLGAVTGASKVAGKSVKEHQIVFVGAGSAAIGVADYLRFAMIDDGLSEKEARARFWIIDKEGLLDSNRRELSDAQKTYARDSNEVENWPRNSHGQIGLSEAIAKLDATILIGLSTVKGIFSESVVRQMAKKTDRPIIFPLSNPTSRSEAEPADLIEWTEGRALAAAGSPFSPVQYRGRSIDIAQCNNVFIFPAVGLGLLASKARRVSDRMMMAAAKALGDQSPTLKDPAASLLPNVRTLRDVAREVAYAVAARANDEGLAPEFCKENGRQAVAESQWAPE
jgi:malate dehydrogenase (oxaloacetate-decarboxylating)